MVKSVRILSNSAMEDLNLTVGSLIDIKESLASYEAEHETNLSRPMGAKNKPVEIPKTDISADLNRITEDGINEFYN